MSLLDWLRPKPSVAAPIKSSGLPSDGLTAPLPDTHRNIGHKPASRPAPAQAKLERQQRREQLYGVVRTVMLRSEVLAADYRFKVLSLDVHGRQFLVMVDLDNEAVFHNAQLRSIEDQITATAARLHQLLVKAVYWRLNPETSQHSSREQTVEHAVAPAPTPFKRASIDASPTAALDRAPAFEPIDPAEVLAFKKAMANSLLDDKASAADPLPEEDSGFEQTQILAPDESSSPLSRTQFGELN